MTARGSAPRGLTIKQRVTRAGGRFYDWSVWLDGPPAALQRIHHVTYLLHPTFPQPQRDVTTRANGFKLSASGWGEFRIDLRLHMQDGTVVRRAHHLRFPAEPFEPTATRASRVFVSAAAADRPLVEELKQRLQALDIAVSDATDITVGQPIGKSVGDLIKGSDVLIAVVSSSPSRWINLEVKMAEKLRIPRIPIIVDEGELPATKWGAEPIRVSSRQDIRRVADKFAESLRGLLGKE